MQKTPLFCICLTHKTSCCVWPRLWTEQAPLPGPRQSISGTVFLSFHRSDLSSVTDMLRNEKPVMFNWSADHQSAQITTGKEPVGEEEGKHIASIFARGKPTAP